MAPDEEAKAAQHEVQRLLGRCLLRLQQYERLIKAIVLNSEGAAELSDPQALRAEREERLSRKTLGQLVGELLGSCLVIGTEDRSTDPMADIPGDGAAIRFRMRLGIPEAALAQARDDLGELVQMRNDLVHHFLDQQDIRSVDGCRRAQAHLIDAHDRIDHHLARLRVWAEHLDQIRQSVAVVLQSDAARELLANGIAPDGKVIWPLAGIVFALREAAVALGENGWTPVDDAGKWIAERYPDQRPARYGCRTWRQVLHESRAFEIRNFVENGRRSARYRERVPSPTRV